MKKLIAILSIVFAFAFSVNAQTYATLENLVVELDKTCPIRIDEGMSMTHVSSEADYIVFVCQIDEAAIADVESMSKVSGIFKEFFTPVVYEYYHDKDTRELMNLILKNKKGLKYRFVGKPSGKSFDVSFTPQEVAAICK